MDQSVTTRLVVGLGNPDRRYENTRHNIGWMVLDEVRRRLDLGNARKAFHSHLWSGRIGPQPVLLAQPQTYMNRSGLAVAEMASFYKLAPRDMLVVLDDMALPPGRLRARQGGSAGGHNGLSDIVAALGTDQVPRLRIGIGPCPPQMDWADYVLSRFGKSEEEVIAPAIQRAADAVADWAVRGITFVMDKYNKDATQGSQPSDGEGENGKGK